MLEKCPIHAGRVGWQEVLMPLNLSLVSLHSQADFGSRDVFYHAMAMIEHRRLALALRERR